jgi:hypothetical protein
MTEFKIPKEIRNALIVGGICLFSTLATQPPSWNIFYTSFIGAGLTFLIELKNTYKIETKNGDLAFKKTSKGTVLFS